MYTCTAKGCHDSGNSVDGVDHVQYASVAFIDSDEVWHPIVHGTHGHSLCMNGMTWCEVNMSKTAAGKRHLRTQTALGSAAESSKAFQSSLPLPCR